MAWRVLYLSIKTDRKTNKALERFADSKDWFSYNRRDRQDSPFFELVIPAIPAIGVMNWFSYDRRMTQSKPRGHES